MEKSCWRIWQNPWWKDKFLHNIKIVIVTMMNLFKSSKIFGKGYQKKEVWLLSQGWAMPYRNYYKLLNVWTIIIHFTHLTNHFCKRKKNQILLLPSWAPHENGKLQTLLKYHLIELLNNLPLTNTMILPPLMLHSSVGSTSLAFRTSYSKLLYIHLKFIAHQFEYMGMFLLSFLLIT